MINRSGHSCCRKTGIAFLYTYMIINFVFSLILVGSLYAAFSIFIRAFFEDEDCDEFGGARAFETAYLALLFIFILMSITKPITQSGWIYSVFVVIFGIFSYVSIGVGFLYFWQNSTNLYVAFLLAATLVGSYVIPPLFNFFRMSLIKYFFGVIILLFLLPTYVNIIIIYSMANLHDVSWGNRATDDKNGEMTRRNLEQFRALYLMVWIAMNAVYGYAIIYITETGQTYYILALTIVVSGQVMIKLVAAIIYFFYEQFTRVQVWCANRDVNEVHKDHQVVQAYGEHRREQEELAKKRALGLDREEEYKIKDEED
jgi:MFS family permease